jgi:hypothetical protein
LKGLPVDSLTRRDIEITAQTRGDVTRLRVEATVAAWWDIDSTRHMTAGVVS